jgi:hypothetical protein
MIPMPHAQLTAAYTDGIALSILQISSDLKLEALSQYENAHPHKEALLQGKKRLLSMMTLVALVSPRSTCS